MSRTPVRTPSKSGSRSYGSASRSEERGGRRRKHEEPRERDEGGKKIYIGNLNIRAEERDLEDIFGEFGEIEDVYIPRDKSTWLGRGFAFVTFSSKDAALDAADDWDNRKFMGRRIA